MPAAMAGFDFDAGKGTQPANNGIYIVRMKQQPVVAYNGGLAGYPATQPGRGQKIDPLNPNVVKYAGYLDSRHNQAISQAGGRSPVYHYRYSYNGFAAQLTPAQAAKMKYVSGVLDVTPDEIHYLETSSTPHFLGLDAENGLWNQLGGKGKAGDGIIIGIIDSGIWPESLSFSDRIGTNGIASKDGKLDYQQIPGWHGKCTPGEDFFASMCNQKLIGAQYFNASKGGNAGIDKDFPWESARARDT